MGISRGEGHDWGVSFFLLIACLGLVACSDKIEETGRTPGDTGCPSLREQPCEESDIYTCDACGQAYCCTVWTTPSDLRWGVSSWDCECISQEGELLLYDTANHTGNPECRYTE